MLVKKKVLQDGWPGSPVPLKIDASIDEICVHCAGDLLRLEFHHRIGAGLHGVASGAVVGSVNFLAAERATRPSRENASSAIWPFRFGMPEFEEIFVDQAIPGPDHDQEHAQENNRTLFHRSASVLLGPQQGQQYFRMVAILQSSSSWAKNKARKPNVTNPVGAMVRCSAAMNEMLALFKASASTYPAASRPTTMRMIPRTERP